MLRNGNPTYPIIVDGVRQYQSLNGSGFRFSVLGITDGSVDLALDNCQPSVLLSDRYSSHHHAHSARPSVHACSMGIITSKHLWWRRLLLFHESKGSGKFSFSQHLQTR